MLTSHDLTSHDLTLRVAERIWRVGLLLRGLPQRPLPQSSSIREQLEIFAQLQLSPLHQELVSKRNVKTHSLGSVQFALPQYDSLFPTPAPWEGEARTAVCFTHDVDLFDGLSYFPLRATNWLLMAARSLQKRDLESLRRVHTRATKWVKLWWRDEDPILGFRPLLELADRYELPSDYFFLSVERALSPEGRLYTFHDPRVIDLLQTLSQRDVEIGLHASRLESQDQAGLLRQKRRLEIAWGRSISSIRHHCLKTRFPSSWFDMIEAGFTRSSNVGHHPPHQGFINGSAWPYPVCSPSGQLWEIPMTIMDVAYGPALSHLSTCVEIALQSMRHTGGVLVLNFHPHYQTEVEASGVAQQYMKIIDLVVEGRRNGWLCLLHLSEIADRLQQRVHSVLDTDQV